MSFLNYIFYFFFPSFLLRNSFYPSKLNLQYLIAPTLFHSNGKGVHHICLFPGLIQEIFPIPLFRFVFFFQSFSLFFFQRFSQLQRIQQDFQIRLTNNEFSLHCSFYFLLVHSPFLFLFFSCFFFFFFFCFFGGGIWRKT